MVKKDTSAYYFYVGVFLVCMSVLMLQIIQTRILSVVAFYYLAFFTISMAMFGLTAGALIVYFKKEYFDGRFLSQRLTLVTTAYAYAIATCFMFQLSSLAVTVPWATVVFVWLKLILLLAGPFVLAGIAVSLALTRSPFPVGVVYGADLVGAATGCLVVVMLLNWIDAPSAVFVVAAIAALAALSFAKAQVNVTPGTAVGRRGLLQRPGLAACALLLLATANTATQYGLQPVAGKYSLENRTGFEFERWNSFSRIVAYRSSTSRPMLWGPSPTFGPGDPVEQRLLNIDGLAGTTMPQFNGSLDEVSFLFYDITNLAYFARNQGRAAIVGVGGGRDLLSAYLFGFRSVTGVELNPIFIDLLTDPKKLRGYAGITDLPGVRLIVDEGRSWFSRTDERFDLVQMSMIDTFAATGAGAFALSENGLYTVEAWRIFLNALTPEGLFTVSRWYSPRRAVEIGRVVSLAMAALFSLGVDSPRDHIFLASTDRLATVVIGRKPLAQSDVDRLTEAARRLRYEILAAPHRPVTVPVFADLLSVLDANELAARAQEHLLDVSAPTDARPFFFNQLRLSQPRDMVTLVKEVIVARHLRAGSVGGNLVAAGTLLLIIVLSAILVVAVVVLPARSSVRAAAPALAWWGTAYFLLIGVGFMFVEIGLIQRISVFIGHPTYGLGVVLFGIILSTGLGSFLSEITTPTKPRHFLLWTGALSGYLLSVPLWLPMVSTIAQTGDLLMRSAISIAMILPAGLLMGFGFPTGMRLVMRVDHRPTPWFWGVNGAAGVLAAGLAVGCSIGFSIDTTIRLGALCYLLLLPAVLALYGNERLISGASRL